MRRFSVPERPQRRMPATWLCLCAAASNQHLETHGQLSAGIEPCKLRFYSLAHPATVCLSQREIGLRLLSGPRFNRFPIFIETLHDVRTSFPIYPNVPEACIGEQLFEPHLVGQCP